LADVPVGSRASIGAGISMGFAEALSDDGSLTGRGSPWLRGLTCGLITTLGGLGHTMPYLVPDSGPRVGSRPRLRELWLFFELWPIAYIRARYMIRRPAGVFPDRAWRPIVLASAYHWSGLRISRCRSEYPAALTPKSSAPWPARCCRSRSGRPAQAADEIQVTTPVSPPSSNSDPASTSIIPRSG